MFDFEDLIPNTVNFVQNYQGVAWDNQGIEKGWGWSVWNLNLSTPYSGTQFAFNSHGKNFLGLTFPQSVYFNGSFFTKASRRTSIDVADPFANAADSVRIHFFNDNLLEIGVSDWLTISRYPIWL